MSDIDADVVESESVSQSDSKDDSDSDSNSEKASNSSDAKSDAHSISKSEESVQSSDSFETVSTDEGSDEGSAQGASTCGSKTLCRNYFILGLINCLAVIAGVLIVLQSAIAINLSRSLHHPFRAALVLYGASALSISISFCCSLSNHRPPQSVKRFKNLWHEICVNRWEINLLWSGPLGCFVLASILYLVPIMGFSYFFSCWIFGQIATRAILTQYGLLWNDQNDLTANNKFGMFLVFAGVAIFGYPKALNEDSKDVKDLFLYSLCSFVSGVANVLRNSLNFRLSQHVGSSYRAGFVQYTHGSIWLLLISLLSLAYDIPGGIPSNKQEEFETWHLMCALLAPVCIVIAIICTSQIGLVRTFVFVSLGLVCGSLVVDTSGILNVYSYDMVWNPVIGSCLVFLALMLTVPKAPIAKSGQNSQQSQVLRVLDLPANAHRSVWLSSSFGDLTVVELPIITPRDVNLCNKSIDAAIDELPLQQPEGNILRDTGNG